jgi:hypothetical protein
MFTKLVMSFLALGFVKDTGTLNQGGIPIFQRIDTAAQGGFTLDETVLPAGTVIPAGTVMGFDEATRKAQPFKGGVLQAAALNTDVNYRVLKGSNVAVGQTVNLPGGTARAITVVDKTNAAYDQFTVATTIGVAAAAGIAAFVSDNGFNKIKGLLKNEVTIPVSGQEFVTILFEGVVYHRRIPPVAASIQAQLPRMTFSESF